jgi:Xaa-Pro aminopeptidase
MPHAPSDALNRRHTAIRQTLATRGLDALVVTSLPNVLYLTNFSGSAALVVITAERLYFITDFRYVAALDAMRGTASECVGAELVRVDASYDETLASVLATMPRARVGFEAAHLTVARHRWIESKLEGHGADAATLIATSGIIERLRIRKDAYEIETLREAARRLSAVARGVLSENEVRRGRTEREIALAIDWRIRRAGFERSAFDTIVAGGPDAALPHAQPGERTLTESDLVVLDFGGVYDSYCVDLTRTVSLGAADARAREVYAAVREAHDRAIEAVAPGRSRFDIDAAARDALGHRGLAEAFGHGTGHGLGIEVHEEPRISRRRPNNGLDEADASDEVVAAGMVFTIEPGAYIPGWGGVRIEDDVLVTDTGVEVLTDVPTVLIEL